VIRLRSFEKKFLARGTLAASIVLVASAAVVAACVSDDPNTGSTSDDGGNSSDGNTTSNDGSTGTDGNTTSDSATPDAGPSVVDVAAGFNNSCALLSDGTVWCWGGDDYGQLGVSSVSLPAAGNCAGPCDPAAHQIPFPAGVRIVQLSVDLHSCAVDSAGDVYCWGRNQYGELGHAPGASGSGDGPCAPTATNCNITPQKVGGLADVTKVEVGQVETCALTAGNSVFCWGFNEAFALGDPTDLDAAFSTSTPKEVATLVGKKITDLALARNATHACAISQGEGVWCWGLNGTGELGHTPGLGTPNDIPSGIFSIAANATPQLLAGTPYAIHVAVAQGTSCGSTDGGTAGCWGTNSQGQFGNGAITAENFPNPLLQADVDASNIATLVGGGGGGSGVFCAVTTDSHLQCWGATDWGEVGNGAYNQVDAAAGFDAGPVCNGTHCADVPQTLPMLVKTVSVGFTGSLALGTDGKVYAWGYNNYAQLGHAPLTAGDQNACSTGQPDDGVGPCNPRPTVVVGLP
jgi:alpha-tubulin suppressor-like RCC1 family protein